MVTTSSSTTAKPLPGGRRLSGTPARVLALLKGRPVARSAREIGEVIGAAHKTVAETLKVLRRRGLVEKVKCGTETRYRLAGSAAVAVPAGSRVLLADRPRELGLRGAWLRLHPAPPVPDDAAPVSEVAS